MTELFNAFAQLIYASLVSSGLKFYFTALLAGGPLAPADVGAGQTPDWYLKPDQTQTQLVSYASVAHEVEKRAQSHARRQALDQMINALRYAQAQVVRDLAKPEENNAVQQRIVELFLTNDGLDDVVEKNARIEEQTTVMVAGSRHMKRVYIRLVLDYNKYLEFERGLLSKTGK